MGRREYTINLRCAEPGCKEWSFSIAETRRDEAETRARYAKNPWCCTRHTKPDEVLSADAPSRIATVEVVELFHTVYGGAQKSIGMYWREPGVDKGGNGFMYGPGFKAYAADFPPGTRLVVTAHIELPEDAP